MKFTEDGSANQEEKNSRTFSVAGLEELALSDIQEKLGAIFMEILGAAERPKVDQSFFELGGDSLKAMRVISHVQSYFGIRLALRTVFVHPTISGLSQTIENVRRDELATKRKPQSLQIDTARPTVQNARTELSYNEQNALIKTARWKKQGKAYDQNVFCAFDVDGYLDLQCLRLAAADVIKRHEILRTGYSGEGDLSGFVLTEVGDVDCLVNERACFDDDPPSSMKELRGEVAGSFDLTKPPLIRISMIKKKSGHSVLTISIPHIACDGQSLDIIAADLAFSYTSRCAGETPLWSEPTAPYSAFAQWQRSQADAEGEAMRYWRSRLDPLQPLAEYRLPSAVAPPLVRTAGNIEMHLSDRAQKAFGCALKELKVTSYVLFVAAVSLAISKISTAQVVGVVSPVNARPPAWRNSAGWFAQVTVIRQEVRDGISPRDFVKQTHVTIADAIDHTLPLRAIMEALAPDREVRRHWEPQVYVDVLEEQQNRIVTFGPHGAREIVVAHAPSLRDGLALWWIRSEDGAIRILAQYERESLPKSSVQHFLDLVENYILRIGRQAGNL